MFRKNQLLFFLLSCMWTGFCGICSSDGGSAAMTFQVG